jgi:hypothetical protein
VAAKALQAIPASKIAAVTPNDGADLAVVARSLWVGGAGNIAVIAADDSSAVTITAVAAGTLLPIRVKRVMSTNTTATLILSLV